MSAERAESSPPDLSAVVLCYREGEGARRVIEPLHDLLSSAGVDFELVLVANYNAGEHDLTPAAVERFAAERDRVRTVAEPKQGAMGWDMQSGFGAARGEHLVTIDGDGQNPVGDVLRVHERLRAGGAEIVKGRRVKRYDGLYRRLLTAAFNLVFQLLFRTGGVRDVNGKPKGMTREAYERMSLTSTDWFIDTEIILEARRLGLRVEEIPVTFSENQDRRSFVGPPAIAEFARNLIAYRFGGRRRQERRAAGAERPTTGERA